MLLKNGNLIDGISDRIRPNTSVLIKDDKIADVGSYDDLAMHNRGEAEVDCTGRTIMPGMIDAHIHLIYRTVSDPYSIELEKSLVDTMADALYNARELLNMGITTVRDVGSRGNIGVAVREAVKRRDFPGPRVVASGRMISTIGGLGDFHPTHVFEDRGYPYSFGEIIVGTDQARKAVRRQIKDGVDFIKVENTGTGFNPLCPANRNTLTVEELSAIVEEATKNGLMVACHSEAPLGVKNAARCKVHDIQHGIFVDDEAVDLMLENNVWLVPTLAMYWGFIEDGPANGIPQAIIDDHLKTHVHHVESIQRCMKRGVKIAAGSDAGLTHFPQGGVRDEIRRFVEIGMDSMQAIKTATSLCAECIGIGDQVGTIQTGKYADILVINDEPLKNIACLKEQSKLEVILQNGVRIK